MIFVDKLYILVAGLPGWTKSKLLCFSSEQSEEAAIPASVLTMKYVRMKNLKYIFQDAGMAELVDAHDSKSCDESHESSILSPGTNKRKALFVSRERESKAGARRREAGSQDFSVEKYL